MNDVKSTYSLGGKLTVMFLQLGEHFHIKHQGTYLVKKQTKKMETFHPPLLSMHP